jgi:hypothetical protein
MVPVGECPVGGVRPRDHLVAQIGVVPPRARGVDELAAADRRPAVHPHHDARRDLSPGHALVGQLREVLAERRAVPPHVQLPGEPLDLVDGGVPALGLVVIPGREVDP